MFGFWYKNDESALKLSMKSVKFAELFNTDKYYQMKCRLWALVSAAVGVMESTSLHITHFKLAIGGYLVF